MTVLANYVIETKTAAGRKRSATDASIYIKLISDGATCSSEWKLLDNWLRDDFEEGRWDTFKLSITDVGTPKSIGLRIEKKEHSDGWFCEKIIVKYDKAATSVEFLVFDWLSTDMWCVAGEETLPHKEACPFIRDVRKREVERQRAVFQWLPRPCPGALGWGLPRFCKAETPEQLPFLFHNSDEQVNSFDATRMVVKQRTLREYLSGKIGYGSCINDFDDYFDVLKGTEIPLSKPDFYEEWQSDEEMGRSTLNGTNPFTLERIESLPDHVSDRRALERALTLADDGMTLDRAFEEKRLYMIDYRKYTRDLPRNIRTKSRESLHAADPVAIFYVPADTGSLRPVLIQLADGDPERVFTPRDDAEDWLLAKMYFKSVDVAVHEWISHYLSTHAMMEPFAVALFRNLSSRHPLYKLLRPHLRTVAAINTMARKDLLGPDSAANQCIGINAVAAAIRAYKSLSFRDLVIPDVLKKKGLDDPKFLPKYYYRDDATDLWTVLTNFIGRMVNIYYEEDEDVARDHELQSWVEDVAVEGIGWQDGNLRDFPNSLTTKDELREYVTVVVFNCSVQHAAINFMQFEAYKVLPNTPGAMRMPPHRRGEGTKRRIMSSLPDAIMTILQLGTSYLLSKYSAEDVFLGDYREDLFANKGAWLAIERFKDDLAKVEAKIVKRNEGLKIPYTVLLPSKVPISIAS